ncbi:urea transporter [archaeon]|nr:MAG: urea transporter [archaeon]
MSSNSLSDIKRWRPGWKEFILEWCNELFISGNMEKTQRFLIDKGWKNRQKYSCGYSTLLFIDITLRGISQVFLCNNPFSGMFILAGVAMTSWELMLYSILSTVVATISAATIGRPPPEDILAGLCGYDGALVGCACWAFLKPSYALQAAFLLPVLAGFVHVAFVNFLRTWELPCFTFAFNVVVIMFLFASDSGVIKLEMASGSPAEHRDSWNEMSATYAMDATIRGVGQFMFADTTVGSAFVIAGICVSSRKGAVIAVIGSIVGWVMARYVFHATFEDNIRAGLYGYNCAGTCCALSGGIFYKTSDGAVVVGIIGAVFASLLTFGFAGMFDGLPVLTFPFIVATWVIMLSRTKWLTEATEYVRPLMRRMSSRQLDQVGKITNMRMFGSMKGSFNNRFNFIVN